MNIWKTTFTVIKTVTIIISLSYIIWKVYIEVQSGVLLNEIGDLSRVDLFILLGVLMLVVVNWFLESVKFRYLVAPIQKIDIGQSIKGVVAGIAVSIFTPKRVGDFGGRVFVLESENRVSGIFATLLGSLSQLLITMLIGIALFPIYFTLSDFIKESSSNIPIFFIIAFVVIVGLLVIYFKISKAGDFLGTFIFFEKHKGFISFLKEYKNQELGRILFFSFLRYAVFTFQFFLLLKIFVGDISYFEAIVGISQVYFFMTIVPTFALGELGVRGSVALWIFAVFNVTASGVLAASISLWILNLAIPALIGSYFLSKFKI